MPLMTVIDPEFFLKQNALVYPAPSEAFSFHEKETFRRDFGGKPPLFPVESKMKTSFVFPPLLFVLTLFVSNMAFVEASDTSLVQPAFAFSEERPVENQAGLIQVMDNEIILSSFQMESGDSLMEEDELGNGTFVHASPASAKPPRCWSAPTPCESSACESFGCRACEPSIPSACSTCDSYESGCHCVDYRMTSCFDHFDLRNMRNKGKNQFFISTWLSAGATLPAKSSKSEVEPMSRFPDIHDKFIMNQLYLTAGRSVNKYGNSFDIGGRLDLLYGTDYYFTSALGLETRTTDYQGGQVWDLDPKKAAAKWNSSNGPRNAGNAALYGLSMPQLYGEVFVPLGLGTTVKGGHVYSMMGYESPMAPENFFYSHTWSMTHGGPMTFTGVVVNQQLTRGLSGLIGYTNGWDVWDNPRGTGSLITGFQWSSLDQSSELAFTIHTGNSRAANSLAANIHPPYKNGDRTNYSLVYSRQLTHRWKWAIQHDLGFEKNVNLIAPSNEFVDGQWASIVNYLYYTINEKWTAGGRFEWFQDTHGSRIAAFYPYQSVFAPPFNNWWTTGQNFYNFTMGLNWKPVPRVTLRPEIRWDWSDVERHYGTPGDYRTGKMFHDHRSNSQFTVGLEGFVKF